MIEDRSDRSLSVRIEVEEWPRIRPLRITGYTFHSVRVLAVTLSKAGQTGRAEAAGAYYKNEDPASMLRQIEAIRPRIEAGIDRERLETLLPSGGARNALDCALWDLDSKLTGLPVWELAEIAKPRPLLTTFTCGADEPENMALMARGFPG